MKKTLGYLTMTFLLFTVTLGCNHVTKPTQELGEDPPQPIIIADGTKIEVYQGSYCWSSNSNSKCVDTVGPGEILKDKKVVKIHVDTKVTYQFNGKQPTEITLSKQQKEAITQETLTSNSFQAPHEAGIYYYSLSAVWLSDKDIRIAEGDSSYVFVIEVVES